VLKEYNFKLRKSIMQIRLKLPNLFYKPCLVLLMILLAACTSMNRGGNVQDGPPNYNVDVSKIPDAVPRPEHLSSSGNHTYVVRGHRYYILHNTRNYIARGTASWYGTKFHRHSTSSGEPYDMLAMTAASRNLPIPSYAEVTNLQNSRSVIVKVNDRGPFEKNRLIDLSYVAAKKLGMLGRGTAYVQVRAIDPYTWNRWRRNSWSVPSYYASSATTTRYASTELGQRSLYLQVGSFASRSHALQVEHQLAHLVQAPVQIHPIRHRHHRSYRVQVGPIANTRLAASMNKRLARAGFSKTMMVTG
jgi:rare lipoprotein A